MKIITTRRELLAAIKDAPDGSTITVETASLLELGQRAANRMWRQDVVFVLTNTPSLRNQHTAVNEGLSQMALRNQRAMDPTGHGEPLAEADQ